MPALVQHMGVDHRGIYILVIHEFLNCSNIVAILKQVRGKGVPEE